MTLLLTVYLDDELVNERRLVLRIVLVRSVPTESISAQFHIKGLSTQSQHFSRGAPVFAGQLKGCLNAQAFDQVRRLSHEILHRHPSDEFGKLFDSARKFAPAELFAPASPAF
jgi:hypothetical protein